MRAVRFAQFGNPADVLTVDDLPTPDPGPGQVLVRVTARPINPSDLFTVAGLYGSLPKLPATPGLEGAGTIASLGPGVSGYQVGQRVVPLGVVGTWQEYLVLPAGSLIPIPAEITDEQAAMLVVNPTSAYLMLQEILHVEPGEWVLQNAANSAVGHFVIELCRHFGYRSINIVRRLDVVEELRAAGADEVICETDEDVASRVKDITGGKGARHALDSVGGQSGSRLLTLLAPYGTLVVFGRIGGVPDLTVDSGRLLFGDQTIRGFWLTNWFRRASPEQVGGLLKTLVGLVASGVLHAPVEARYDLADIKQAVAAAQSRARRGKILIVG